MGSVMLRAAVVLWLAAAIVGDIAADVIEDRPEVVTLYARGKRLMREGAWLEASKTFQELAGRFPQSANLDLFVFNRAKSDYYFGSYSEAIAGFSYFVSRFPASAELAHAHFFLGNAYYLRADVTRAVKNYFESYRLSSDSRLTALLESSLRSAFENAASVKLGQADFEKFPEDKRCALIKAIVDGLIASDRVALARQIAGHCNQKLDFSGKLEYQPGSSTKMFEVAVVLPFSGELQSFGEEIYAGAVVGAEFCRRQTGLDFTLATYDTHGDPINAARIIGELVHSETHAAIGPLTSEEAAVSSASLTCGNLPLIIPAATQAGLTALSPTSFQLSPNIELEGVLMAEYARNRMNFDSAAIITSTRTEHLRMARAFSERFRQLGGELVAIEYYRPRDKDFGPYIRDVKAIILGEEPDSVYFINEDGDTLDFDIVPAQLDCLFLPGSPGQLKLVLPQINFYNLSAFYLGTDGWGDRDIYSLSGNITRRTVFPSPFLAGATGDDYLAFAAAYDARYGRPPQRLASL